MPGTLQFLGDSQLKFGPIVTDYGPKGITTKFIVSCTNVDSLVAYYNYINRFGASGTLRGLDQNNDGSLGAEERTLEVSFPGSVNIGNYSVPEYYFDSWELITDELTNTIFANPLIVGSSLGWMNYNDKQILSYMARTNELNIGIAVSAINALAKVLSLNYPTAGQGGVVDATTPTGYAFGPLSSVTSPTGKSQQILIEVLKGQTEYESPSYVLRHTSYCSPGALYNTSIAYTQQIYTTAQLLSEVGSGWTYNLPPRLYSKIAGIPQQYAAPDEANFYQWGFLKKITQETVLSNFMVEVHTEYALALWSTLRYLPR
jgi:hypothetical protein